METNSQTDSRQTLLHVACVASIVVAAGCVFWPALSFDFVSWGDPLHVTAPGLAPAEVVGQQATTFAPVADASLAIDRSLWGSHSTGFHLTSVLLHLVNASLVFVLLWRLTDKTIIAWATALLFAVHPVQVETVAWVSARGTLIGTTAALACMLLWLRGGRGRSIASVACLGVAVLASVSAAVLPLVMLAFCVLASEKKATVAFRELRLHFVVATVALGICLAKSSAATALVDASGISLPQMIAMKVTALWTYLGMLMLPQDLCIAYAPAIEPETVVTSFCVALFGLAAMGLCVMKLRRARPYLTFGLVTLAISLLPAVLFTGYQSSLLTDQFVYLPCIAFAALLSSTVEGFIRVVERGLGTIAARATSLTVVAGVAGVLALAAAEYLPVWTNSSTLWNHAATQLPDAVEVRIQQANALRYQGRENDALLALQTALKQFPRGTAARKQVDTLMKDWLMESTEATMKRRSNHRAALM